MADTRTVILTDSDVSDLALGASINVLCLDGGEAIVDGAAIPTDQIRLIEAGETVSYDSAQGELSLRRETTSEPVDGRRDVTLTENDLYDLARGYGINAMCADGGEVHVDGEELGLDLFRIAGGNAVDYDTRAGDVTLNADTPGRTSMAVVLSALFEGAMFDASHQYWFLLAGVDTEGEPFVGGDFSADSFAEGLEIIDHRRGDADDPNPLPNLVCDLNASGDPLMAIDYRVTGAVTADLELDALPTPASVIAALEYTLAQ